MNPLLRLAEYGQSYWLDNLSREIIRSGELRNRVETEGLRGVTSNPAIFHKAISKGTDYDEEITALVADGCTTQEIYEQLVVTDIADACDVLRPVFDDTNGLDGYVSLEVSPRLIHDTEGSLEEGRRLWKAVDRPNLMIKIPGTPAGVPVIEELLFDGINVNVTLLFDVAAYEAVAGAYLRALSRRREAGRSMEVASVASFFLSRIDVQVDRLLGHRIDANPDPDGPASMLGEAAIASARLAYRSFQRLFSGPAWAELAGAGARAQRLLWASTSSKNPLYDPVRYVEPLIGKDTVNTMPESTIEAFRESGTIVADTIEADVDRSEALFAELERVGIDMAAVASHLVDEGADKFIVPFDALLAGLAARRAEIAGESDRFRVSESVVAAVPASLLGALEELRFSRRLFRRDASLWSVDPDEQDTILRRTGWLTSHEISRAELPGFRQLAEELRDEGVDDLVVLGMGGSSLGAAVLVSALQPGQGHPRLRVLDDIDPNTVRDLEADVDLARTIFLVASKSGTTIETNALYRYFRQRVEESGATTAGSRFVAITDAGTPLARLAETEGFRRVVEAQSDVGGRFSVLTAFGVLPAALAGFDVDALLDSAAAQRSASGPEAPLKVNPSLGLGVALGALANRGRSRLTLYTSPSLGPLDAWLEQLIAESTGKDGKGILPIIGEPRMAPDAYGADRVFVHVGVDGEHDRGLEAHLVAVEEAGHPVIRIRIAGPEALGGEFYRWELAVAAAAVLMGVNPFDEPDVAAAKQRARDHLDSGAAAGSTDRRLTGIEHGLELYMDNGSDAARDGVAGRLGAWIDATGAGDYVAVLAYFAPSEERNRLTSDLRAALARRTGAATTLGFGPRYLHSAGQLHKGGPPNATFLVLTADETEDLRVPEEGYGLAELRMAQATGDEATLRELGRRVARVNLGWYVDRGLETLTEWLNDER